MPTVRLAVKGTMPTSVPGCSERLQTGLPVVVRRRKGFTLIEILVVLVIISIIVVLAAVRFGQSDVDTLQRESERLSLLLETARDEAIASGAAAGFSTEPGGYRFWQQQPDASWQPVADSEVLRARELPQALRLDDIRVNLQPLSEGGRILFSPSGVNAPFSLTLSAGVERRTLQADALGRITVVNPQASTVVAQ